MTSPDPLPAHPPASPAEDDSSRVSLGPFRNAARALRCDDIEAMLQKHLPGPTVVGLRALKVYQRALVHRSYACRSEERRGRANAECPKGVLPLQPASYERLEFLGDAVLGLATASYLHGRYPEEDEGFLTRMRTKLVNGRTLADLCRRHTPLPALVASSAARENPDQEDPRVLEDVFEAFLGALYVDRGFDAACAWLVGFLEANVDFAELVATQDGAKAVLNRHCMHHFGFVPETEELATGVVRLVTPTGSVVATGTGAGFKEAEEVAVRNAMAYYQISSSRRTFSLPKTQTP